jgi:phosphonate C-P lyase system protein PhnH
MPELTLRALEARASASLFRTLLFAASHPGRIARFEPADHPDAPPIAVAALLLADLETTLHIDVDDAELARAVAAATGAPDAGSASDMVVTDRIRPELVRALRIGSALAPEAGCRLVAACTTLESVDDPRSLCEVVQSTATASVVVGITGPGVPSARWLRIGGWDRSVVDALAERNAGFPAGVDTTIVTPSGEVVVLPRSARLSHRELDLERSI